MSVEATWMAVGLTIAVLALYEALLCVLQRPRPRQTAPSAHATLLSPLAGPVAAVDVVAVLLGFDRSAFGTAEDAGTV